jgi:hypothetical protein
VDFGFIWRIMADSSRLCHVLMSSGWVWWVLLKRDGEEESELKTKEKNEGKGEDNHEDRSEENCEERRKTRK